jgi:hypothetical protein
MDLNPLAHASVMVAFSSNYFPTLCEIPTNLRSSVWTSVIVAFSSNYFPTLCEMPTDLIPSVWTSVIVHVKKDYICVTYLPSCKHLKDKLSIAQNNNNNA